MEDVSCIGSGVIQTEDAATDVVSARGTAYTLPAAVMTGDRWIQGVTSMARCPRPPFL
jgi:hypothetical protein